MRLRIPPLLLTVIFAAMMLAMSSLLPRFSITLPARSVIASCFAAVGVAVCAAGLVSFRNARTTINPARPDQTSALVVNGIYRISRNPMYLGFLILLVAWGVFLQHVLAILLAPALFVAYLDRFQIKPEEQALSRLFGEYFASYKSDVRRWL